jgi:hypothetical protein
MLISDLLNTISQTLDSLDIPYMLSGSLALNLYAIPRSTRDIDIVVELRENQTDQLIAAIKDKFYFHEPTIREEIKRAGMFNIIHFDSSYKVDFIIRSSHPFELQKFHRRLQIEFFDCKIWVITLEDLIISKLMWIQQLESELQKRDILSLLENKNADLNYIKYWCKELKLNSYNLISYE